MSGGCPKGCPTRQPPDRHYKLRIERGVPEVEACAKGIDSDVFDLIAEHEGASRHIQRDDRRFGEQDLLCLEEHVIALLEVRLSIGITGKGVEILADPAGLVPTTAAVPHGNPWGSPHLF